MKISRLLPLIAIFATSAVGFAQGPDKNRAQVEELTERARRAKAEGRDEEAEDIMRKVKQLQGELREGAPQKPEHDKAAGVRREIEELQKAGKHEEAERLAKKVFGGDPGGAHAEGPERLQHLLQAIEHLRAAGLNEPAASLEGVAREMKENLGRKGALPESGGKPHPGAPADGGDVRAQMQKLAHSVEELRAQVQSLRGEGGKKKEMIVEKGEKGGKVEKKGDGSEKKFEKTEKGERVEKFEKKGEKPAGSEKGAKEEGSEKGGKVFKNGGGDAGPEKDEKK